MFFLEIELALGTTMPRIQDAGSHVPLISHVLSNSVLGEEWCLIPCIRQCTIWPLFCYFFEKKLAMPPGAGLPLLFLLFPDTAEDIGNFFGLGGSGSSSENDSQTASSRVTRKSR